jgi:uncharacterized membrane protein (UPF0182 family)
MALLTVPPPSFPNADGDVTFYLVDPADPIAGAYAKAFPKLFTAPEKIPAELRQHFRYPEDLFRVQTNMWGRYHIGDPTHLRSARWAERCSAGTTRSSTGTKHPSPTGRPKRSTT